MPISARKKHQDRQLKNHTHADHDGQKQVGILADRDHRLELLAVIDQEIQRRGIDHLVGEQPARQEQQDGREHEGKYVALFVAIQAGRNEHPDLVKHEGRSHEQAGESRHLQVKIEGFGGIEIDQLFGHPVALQRVHDGALHVAEDEFVVVPAGEESNRYGNDGIDQAPAQFLEVFEEAHGGQDRRAILLREEVRLPFQASGALASEREWCSELSGAGISGVGISGAEISGVGFSAIAIPATDDSTIGRLPEATAPAGAWIGGSMVWRVFSRSSCEISDFDLCLEFV